MNPSRQKHLAKVREIDGLAALLEVPAKELKPLLLRMKARLGPCHARRVLNVSGTTLSKWCTGKGSPGPPERRLIWLVYCALFEPEKVESVFHILTWGRFATDPKCQMLRRERTARGTFAREDGLTPASPAANVSPSSAASTENHPSGMDGEGI